MVITLHFQLLFLGWERFQGSLSLRNSGFWHKFSSSHAPRVKFQYFSRKVILTWTEKRIIGYKCPDLKSHLFFFLFLFLSIYLVSCITHSMTGGGKKRKTNKKLRRTKPLTHWAFLYNNLQGNFLRSESHLWGFSTSPLWRRAEPIIAHEHTLTPHREVSWQIRDCFPFPHSSQEGMQCTEQCLYYCWREGFLPKEIASPGFLMNHVLTGLVVNCYRCALDSLMRRRKFRRPKSLWIFCWAGHIKTACVPPGIAKQGVCQLSSIKTFPFGVKALMCVDCHKGE